MVTNTAQKEGLAKLGDSFYIFRYDLGYSFEELFLRLEILPRSVETRVYNGSYYEAIRMGVEMSGP